MSAYNIEMHLEDLPHKNGKLSHRIDWKKSIGKSFRYIFNGDEDVVKIIDVKDNKYTLEYKGNIYKNVSNNSITKSDLRNVFKLLAFKYKIGQNIIDKKRDFTILDYYDDYSRGYLRKIYKCRCNKCVNYSFEIIEGTIDNNGGCPCCAGKVVVEGINDIPTTDPWMIDYFQGGYDEAKVCTSGSGKTIYPICPDCGRIKDKPMKICTIKWTHSIGCKCSDGVSYPEKFFISLLDQLGINYKWQLNKYDFKWCDKYKYDFYLTDYNYIIELHGEQHYRNAGFKTKYIKQKEIDNSKKILALKNGIEQYIEVDCSESNITFIKNNILDSQISNIVDLSNINWNKCDGFATKNIAKDICLFYENNKPILTSVIAQKYNVSRGVLINYLKKGTRFGWCNYNAKKSHQYGSAYSGINNTKYVEIYKDNQLIIFYDSLQELENKSLNDLGVKLLAARASQSAKNNQVYKGYTFKVYPIGYKKTNQNKIGA